MHIFQEEVDARLRANDSNHTLKRLGEEFLAESITAKYSYNFSWLGRPVIQYPQDIVAMQEIIFAVKPDLIIETGVAHGGSLVFSASMLELNSACGGPSDALVLGIDIEIRKHNRKAIEVHPMYRRIRLLEGSSLDEDIITQVKQIAAGRKSVLVCLDSNHTHHHVLQELRAYAPLTSVGSYCVVFDTIIEDMTDGACSDRPWGRGNSPKTAVWEFLKTNPQFAIDKQVERKLLISVAPDGYLKRISL